MTPVPGPVTTPPEGADPTAVDPFAGDDPMGGLGSLLGQWATAIGPMFFGLQVGSVVGHLSHRALGQYPLAIPWAPSDELLLVTTNITAFADDWSLPEEEALLWVCARELASNSVLTRPAVRGRLEELLVGAGRTRRRRPNRTWPDGSVGWASGRRRRRAWTSSRSRGCSAIPRRCSATC